ncbi:unnamed protein product [Meloidogyne enterolobii]|uniref:Uncharacterized protein n=1 Tax=Meloidogyne enterolobii TaxID=390850 RepID=A0ACB0XZG0_MELEN
MEVMDGALRRTGIPMTGMKVGMDNTVIMGMEYIMMDMENMGIGDMIGMEMMDGDMATNIKTITVGKNFVFSNNIVSAWKTIPENTTL